MFFGVDFLIDARTSNISNIPQPYPLPAFAVDCGGWGQPPSRRRDEGIAPYRFAVYAFFAAEIPIQKNARIFVWPLYYA